MSGLKPGFDRASSLYCTRVLQMNHWVAIMSRKPIGIVRDLLLVSQEEILPVARLLNLLGDRIRLQHALLRQAKKSEQLQNMTDRLRSDFGDLRRQLAAAEKSEMDAQISFAQTDIRLAQVREKESLTKRLETLHSEDEASIGNEEAGPSDGNDTVLAGAKEIFQQIRQHHTGKCEFSTSVGKSSGTSAAVMSDFSDLLKSSGKPGG